MAVGVGFGAGDLPNATALAVGIGLQNAPEGLAVAVALIAEGSSRTRAFLIASATALVEPIGGFLGVSAVTVFQILFPWALTFAAGAMFYVISHEIIPETHSRGFQSEATAGLTLGLVAGAQASYQRALGGLRRAQQADVTGKYTQQLADAIALVERNLARIMSEPPLAGGVGPGLVTGPDAREAFEALRRSNEVAFADLENVSTGIHDSLRLGGTTLSLRTTEIRYPLPPVTALAGTPVAVLPYNFVTSPPNHRFMGVARGNIPDGQSKYEIILSKPASHVGLMRDWNTDSLTRFYNEAGTLLAEHRNTTNHEFVGYVADLPENRVFRIEFDGVPSEPASTSNKVYQVGEVDDLYVGTPSGDIGKTAGITIDNPTVDGIPLDNCLYWGNQCGGEAASDAFCKSRGYTKAISWRTKPNSPPTKVIGDGQVCEAGYCGPVVQVVCEE